VSPKWDFRHKENGTYYLSWGCFYATGSSVYGPFVRRLRTVVCEPFIPHTSGIVLIHAAHPPHDGLVFVSMLIVCGLVLAIFI